MFSVRPNILSEELASRDNWREETRQATLSCSRTQTKNVKNNGDQLKLTLLAAYLFTTSFVAGSVDACDEDELEDAAEDKDHAGEHPDVKEGDVGDPGHALPDCAEHGGEGEEGGHPHPNPARHWLRGDEYRQPAQDDEHSAGDVGLDDVVANLPGQVKLQQEWWLR